MNELKRERATKERHSSTKEKILDAAETLFAQKGFARVSIREITQAAQVNLAAVHYHFGSKEQLIQQVLFRRIEAVNRLRLEALAALEQRYGEKAIPIEELLRALAMPLLETHLTDEERRRLCRLFGWLIGEDNEQIRIGLSQRVQTVFNRFTKALQRSLPEIPNKVLWQRLHFVMISLPLVALDPVGILQRHRVGSLQRLVEEWIRFTAAGLSAPVPTAKGKGR